MKKLCLILLLITQQLLAKDFKGAELYSSIPVLYGKFEMCMRSNKVSGALSTFFLYKEGSEQTGAFWEEIDIEIFGKGNAVSFQSNIISGTSRQHSEEVHTYPFSLGDDFHVYGLEWTPNYVAWYFDGQLVRKTTGGQVNDLKSPMGLRFNTWVSSAPAWVGPFDPANLPTQQMVDWISYSSYTPGAGNNGADFTSEWKDDFNSIDPARWNKANWTFNENLVDFDPDNAEAINGKLVLSITRAGQTGYNGPTPTGECSVILGTNPSPETETNYKLVYHKETGSFNLKTEIPNATVTLRNSEGKQISEHKANTPFGTELKTGMYICTLHLNGKTVTRKVMKY